MGTTDAADVRLLRERGAADLDHPGGDLLSHLVRTAARLERWGAQEELVRAGRWHAAYGTDGFPTALFSLDERALVVDEIGDTAEAIVYRYGSCDRRFVYPQIGGGETVRFRDRFTRAVERTDKRAVRTFVELTVANELDVVAHSTTLRREHGSQMAAQLGAWSPMLSAAACTDLTTLSADIVQSHENVDD
jgi:hypothetical protein